MTGVLSPAGVRIFLLLRFQVFTAAIMKMAAFLVVALCSLVNFYQTTRRNSPEDSYLRYFSSQRSDLLWGLSNLLSDVCQGAHSLELKRSNREADSLHTCSAEVKNAWSLATIL
jgi:hypothetical protein